MSEISLVCEQVVRLKIMFLLETQVTHFFEYSQLQTKALVTLLSLYLLLIDLLSHTD